MTPPRWLSGLRARLVLAFVLVAVAGAVAAAWAGHASARSALVSEAQQRAVDDLRARIGAVAPELAYPPDQDALDRLRSAVGDPALVTYGSARSVAGSDLDLVPDELRTAVRERGELVVQRVAPESGPRLLIGTPVVETAVDGARRPSGIEVYAVHDLGPTQQQIDASAQAAVRSSLLVLPLAVLLALLAAGGVLRPVRELHATARRLAGGDLDARLRVRGSDELAELSATFNRMATELDGAMARLRRMEADARRFVADVSHELRTPLTTLTAVVEVLEADAGRLPPEARDSALLAVEETRRLTRLVEDLMEVSRFDAGAATLRWEEVDVRRAIADCLRARGWDGRVELDAPADVRAVLDRRRLDVIVANLVGNALRHGRPPVRVRVRADEREIVLVVVDHGDGLPDGGAARVFDRFAKADTARARSDGSGLGLAIARENARLHGGEITADDEPGAGARFVVRLPRGSES